MPVNVEIKARTTDPAGLRARVDTLASEGPSVLQQVDTFFVVSHGRLKLRDFTDGTGELIYYERPDAAGPRPSTYLRAPTTDPDGLRTVLSSALGVRTTVRKQRELFMIGQTRVHLDEVDRLGAFLELEVVLRSDQTADEGARIAHALMVELGVEPRDLIAGAYADLLDDSATA